MPFQVKLSRRAFLMGCSAAVAAQAGARITHLAFASPEVGVSQEVVVQVFLRGGWDALNVVLPIDGPERGYYELKRKDGNQPGLAIPTSGAGAAIPIGALDGVPFGFHPALAPLRELYQTKALAVVHATGLKTSNTRSHFDAQQFVETGTPNVKTTSTGWLTRHLRTAPNLPPTILLPALAAGNATPMALLDYESTVTLSGAQGFDYNGYWKYEDRQIEALRNMYASNTTWLHQAGIETLDSMDIIESKLGGSYTPANGAVYPNNNLGNELKTVAQMIKANLGLRTVTIDYGGWDTHENQQYNDQQRGPGGGYFWDVLEPLARGLFAFYLDLSNGFTQNLTLVVVSEFGRRVQRNANNGTDHGHGNLMLVLGGYVNGGKIYGKWPGLADDRLYDQADLAVTTDYRTVLSEILEVRAENPNVTQVFPPDAPVAGTVAGTVAGAVMTGSTASPTGDPYLGIVRATAGTPNPAPNPGPGPTPGPTPAPGNYRIMLPLVANQ